MTNDDKTVFELDIIDILKTLKEKLWFIILTSIICCSIAFCYLKYKTPIYKSTLSILINPIKASSSMDDLIEGTLSASSNSNINTEVSLLTSKQCLENAINSLDLSQYSLGGESYANRTFTYQNLLNMVEVKTQSGTKVVSISVSDANPLFASDFVNAIGQSYKNLLTRIVQTSKTSQRISLERQIPENQKLLEQATEDLLNYSNANGTAEVSQKMEVLASYIATIQILQEPLKIQKEQQEEFIMQNSLFDKIETILLISGISNVLEKYSATAKEYYLYQSSEKSSMDDRVLVLSTTMNTLSTSLFEEIQNNISDRNLSHKITDYLLTLAKIDVLSDIERQYKDKVSEFEAVLSIEARYRNQVSMYQTLILSLIQLLEETKMVEAASESDSVIIDKAEPASAPFKPEKFKIMVIALVIGVFSGAGIVILASLFDRSVYTEEDVKKVFDDNKIPSIGWIPYISTKNSDGTAFNNKIVTTKPESYEAERFRILCANISLVSNNSKVYIFNSMGVGEGKSFCSVNVGATFAATGKKTLIIDCDLRKPELEHIFGIKHLPFGVTSVMNGVPVKDCIVQPIPNIPSLHLLPAGHSSRNPNIVFSSQKFSQMIQELKSMYDYILLDCPPLSFGSDFMILSNFIDAYAIILRAGVSTTDSLKAIVSSITTLKVQLLGYVFNGVLQSSRSYGKYNYRYRNYKYSNYYNYGSNNKKTKRHHKQNYKRIYFKELEKRNSKTTDFQTQAIPAYAKENLSTTDTLDSLTEVEKDINARGKGKKDK